MKFLIFVFFLASTAGLSLNAGAGDALDEKLLDAVKTKNSALVIDLLSRGANPNTKVENGQVAFGTNAKGCGILIVALAINNNETTAALLSAGADPNEKCFI